jgi:outer membrane protein TolC
MSDRGRTFESWVRFLALYGMTLGGAPTTADAQLSVTFDQAMTMVEQRNERWRAADLSVSRAQESRAEQRGLYWPTVGITGRYAHLNDELFVDLTPLHDLLSALNPGATIPPLTATVLRNDPVKATVGASWTVFAGGRIRAANRAAEAGVDAAGADRSSAQHALTTELADRYFKRRLAADVLNVRKQALETLDKHVEDARRLQQAGQIARTESLRAQVARAEADRDYKVAQRDLALASTALRATLGTDQEIVPVTPLPPAPQLEPRERFATTADSGNPDLRRLLALKEQSRQGTSAAKAEYLPALRLFGQAELFQHRLNTTTDPKWIVGAELQWKLFDGFGREHRVAAAKLAEQEVGTRHEGARRDVATLVQSRYDEYVSAVDQFTSLQSSVDLAEESLRSEQRAFAEGVGTSLEVVDAELARSRIEVERLNAQYDAVVALARLLEASGESSRLPEYIGQ